MPLRSTALRLVKRTAAAADHLRPRQRGVVVLLYHRVGAASGVEVDLPTALFDQQMETLAASGRAVTLDAALAWLDGPRPAGPPEADPVVVTFDDGTADVVDVAMPVLVRHGVPATLYVATDFVERQRSFPDDGQPASWSGLADAMATGLLTIGSHTHTHALLDRLVLRAAEEELDRSKGLVEEHLGTEAAHFAYPKAVLARPEVEAEVRRRFRSAAVGRTRPNPHGRTDPYRLNRSALQVADGMHYFARKVAGGMALEDSVRRLLNRRRYADAVT